MWTDKELSTILESVNPLPDPETLSDHGERLWASLESKRADRVGQPMRPRFRRRTVLVMASLAVIVAVPAAAWALYSDAPPLDRDFGSVEDAVVTVYGREQGIPDGCAWRLAFTPADTPLVGGYCGVLELTDGQWDLIADEEAVGMSLTDMAVDGEGGIWVASPDQPLRRVIGDTIAEMEIVSPWIAAAPDGTIWAVDYGPTTAGELVTYSEGSWRHIEGTEMVNSVAVGSDGTVWILAGGELARISGGFVEVVDFDGPDGSPMFVATAPDGAVWIAVQSSEVIDRLGVSDLLSYIVRYDGSSSLSIEVPFAEISDLAVHPDGTLWASSSLHGVFFYDGGDWTRYGVAEGMAVNEVRFLDIASDGSVYATTDRGVARIRTDG